MPLLRLVCPLDDAVFSSQSIWHPRPQAPYYFDAIGGDKNSTTISRYVLKHIENKQSDGLPCSIPVLVDSFQYEDINYQLPRFRSFQLRNGDRLISWMHDVALRLHLSTTATAGPGPHNKVSGTLWQWPRLMRFQSDQHYSFCAWTGRLCVSSWDHEIRVLDYLMPPN